MRVASALAFLAIFLCAPAQAETIPGQLIVEFGPSSSAGQRWAVHRAARADVKEKIPAIGAVVVNVPVGREAAALRTYRTSGAVRSAERDVVVRASTDDPSYGRQWALENTNSTIHVGDGKWAVDADVDAPDAWAYPLAPAVKVAVLDTGVDQDHPDLPLPLAGDQKNFTTAKSVDDIYGHGTHVYGTIAARPDNGIGVSGVARNVQMLSGKVLGDNGSGSCSSIVDGITWAADQGAKVISMSLGGGYCSAEESAIAYATKTRGALVIAAAGNSSTSSTTNAYPGAFADVVGVAATDDSDRLSSFSNYGSWVDIAAPGTDIYATLPNHTNRIGTKNYGYLSGTSMATPNVSGVAALVAGSLVDTNGNGRTNDELRTRLLSTADNKKLNIGGGSRLNACRAVGQLSAC